MPKNCQSSSDIIIRCPNPSTTNCVTYQGTDFDCLDICKGEVITYTLESLSTNVCTLITTVDLTNIVIPTCDTIAWGVTPKNIFNFTQFLLNQDCYLQGQIDSINGNLASFNPLITLDYKCCTASPCVTLGTVTLTTAIQNVLNCLCDLKSYVGSAAIPSGYDSLSDLVIALNSTLIAQSATITNLQTQVTNLVNANIGLQTQINNQNATILSLSDKIDCIIAAGGFSC